MSRPADDPATGEPYEWDSRAGRLESATRLTWPAPWTLVAMNLAFCPPRHLSDTEIATTGTGVLAAEGIPSSGCSHT